MKLCVIFLALIAASCGPRCLQGHYETRHVPFECHVEFMNFGDTPHPICKCTPAHDEQVFICDRYEVEKDKQ